MSWGAMLAPVAGAIMGEIMGDGQRRKQVQQQRELNAVNEESAKNMGKFNYEQQMKMLKETGPKFQVGQLKEAGMSVGNMYGGSGSGGAIQATPSSMSPASAEGVGAQSGAVSQMGMLASQMALMGAQKENIEADTANKKAAAGNTTVDTEGKTIANKIAGETSENVIAKAAAEASSAMSNAQKDATGAYINMHTQDDEIKRIKAEAVGAVLENAVKKANVGKTEQEVKAISEGIKQKWAEIAQRTRGLDQDAERIEIEKFGKEIQANYPNVWNIAGKYVNDAVDAVNHAIGQKDYKKHSVENNKR